jgi:hypothetical protein
MQPTRPVPRTGIARPALQTRTAGRFEADLGRRPEDRSHHLKSHGRTERDDWVKQAKALAEGGEAKYIRVFGKNRADGVSSRSTGATVATSPPFPVTSTAGETIDDSLFLPVTIRGEMSGRTMRGGADGWNGKAPSDS